MTGRDRRGAGDHPARARAAGRAARARSRRRRSSAGTATASTSSCPRLGRDAGRAARPAPGGERRGRRRAARRARRRPASPTRRRRGAPARLRRRALARPARAAPASDGRDVLLDGAHNPAGAAALAAALDDLRPFLAPTGRVTLARRASMADKDVDGVDRGARAARRRCAARRSSRRSVDVPAGACRPTSWPRAGAPAAPDGRRDRDRRRTGRGPRARARPAPRADRRRRLAVPRRRGPRPPLVDDPRPARPAAARR